MSSLPVKEDLRRLISHPTYWAPPRIGLAPSAYDMKQTSMEDQNFIAALVKKYTDGVPSMEKPVVGFVLGGNASCKSTAKSQISELIFGGLPAVSPDYDDIVAAAPESALMIASGHSFSDVLGWKGLEVLNAIQDAAIANRQPVCIEAGMKNPAIAYLLFARFEEAGYIPHVALVSNDIDRAIYLNKQREELTGRGVDIERLVTSHITAVESMLDYAGHVPFFTLWDSNVEMGEAANLVAFTVSRQEMGITSGLPWNGSGLEGGTIRTHAEFWRTAEQHRIQDGGRPFTSPETGEQVYFIPVSEDRLLMVLDHDRFQNIAAKAELNRYATTADELYQPRTQSPERFWEYCNMRDMDRRYRDDVVPLSLELAAQLGEETVRVAEEIFSFLERQGIAADEGRVFLDLRHQEGDHGVMVDMRGLSSSAICQLQKMMDIGTAVRNIAATRCADHYCDAGLNKAGG